MSDVRSLLRQQRASRRIDHAHAAYSDAGKLLCTVCHEQIKTESLWDSHITSHAHRLRAQQRLKAAPVVTAKPNGKRKHDTDEDAVVDETMDVDSDEAVRRKRSRPDIATAAADETTEESESPTAAVAPGSRDKDQNQTLTLTPPRLTRRTSTTPSQGVELQIPSRPATPAHRDGSSASTPGTATAAPVPRRQSLLSAPASGAQVDEAEWAAFEADIAAVDAPYDADAVISAPAMTAEESAAALRAEEEAAEKRRAQADVDLEDEREEATRALEDEFEEMEELEARVRRLKEQREALRKKRSESFSQEQEEVAVKLPRGLGKENLQTPIAEEDEDEDEDDEDDEDDEWDGFRFRTAT